eukprot:Skav205764  [mRNA]  locus=scaffold1714:312651:313013:- [translate_table: standard]
MGCTATRVVDDMKVSSPLGRDHVDLDQPGLKEMDSSYDTWQWREGFAKGVPCPPSRKMHDRHLQKLENFMQKVEAAPELLSTKVQLRRGPVSEDEIEDFEKSIYDGFDHINIKTVTLTSL